MSTLRFGCSIEIVATLLFHDLPWTKTSYLQALGLQNNAAPGESFPCISAATINTKTFTAALAAAASPAVKRYEARGAFLQFGQDRDVTSTSGAEGGNGTLESSADLMQMLAVQ